MIERLNKLVEFKNGKKRPTEKGVIPVYGGNGILGYTNQFNAERNNLIIGRVGAYCGCVYKCNGKCWISDNAIVGNVRRNADYNFAYYLLKSLKLNKRHIGSGQPLMTQSILNSIEVEVPGYSTQKRIGKILNDIDSQIDANNRTNDNLLEISKTIFSNDFGGKIRGGKEIGDYLVPKRGKALLSKDAIKGDIPVIAGGLEPATFHNLSNTKAPVITISASGANAGFVNLWQREVWSSDSSFIDATITENPFFWYVMLVVRQDEIYKAQTGSAQAHIYPKHIAEMSIGDIKQSEISTYEKKVASIFEQIEQNKTENRRLTKLRDTLLPELLNGKIDISNIDI